MLEDSGKLKNAALKYALAFGWLVFPVVPQGKKPATATGFKEATRDPVIISQWWDNNPNYNIGIATGKGSSGFFVIDLDEDESKGISGENELEKYINSHGALPKTVISQTPRGGKHILFTSSTDVRCKTGVLPGVDLRGSGGYIVAPPSVVNGKEYRWITDPGQTPIAEADSNVFTFISPIPADFDIQRQPYSAPETIPEGQRVTELVRMLGSLQSKGFSDEIIRGAIHTANDTQCVPPLSDHELETMVFPSLKRFEKGTAPYNYDIPFTTDIADIISHLIELRPERNKRFGWHDAGNGNLFADLFSGVACFVPERKKWFVFDGACWQPDTANMKVMGMCKQAADALMSYTVQEISDEKLRTDYIKHISRWQQYKYRETVLKDAASVHPVSLSEFDSDPYLFNCLNGMLNLRDMSFHEHVSTDRLTMIAGVEYRPEARCERWERFIDEVTMGDKALAKFIQKALGYALTGDTRFECFFILYGATSRNGKSTLSETIMRLVGDYGKTANPETIAKRKYSDSRSPSEDIARLAGARFVNMSEPDKTMALNSALVKTLTGGDTVNARFLGENSFQFRPQFKMFIDTNHLPYVSDTTIFSSDRAKIIPFKRHFSETERDSRLKDRLTAAESLSGILNWCLDGLKMLRREGLAPPEAVKQATREYEEFSDRIGQFIDSELEADPRSEVATNMVFCRYQDWCYSNGFKPEGKNEFRKSLASKGVEIKQKRPEEKRGDRSAAKKSFVLGYTLKIPQS